MEEKNLTLEQVVVTAMGIQKKMSSLTYSTQQISSNELTRAKEPNMINTLAGKTAGVQINKTANLGGSAKSPSAVHALHLPAATTSPYT